MAANNIDQNYFNISQKYYVPFTSRMYDYAVASPVQEWAPRNTPANKFSDDDLDVLINYWLDNDANFNYVPYALRPAFGVINRHDGYLFKDDLEPTKEGGHPQSTIPMALQGDLHYNIWEDMNVRQPKVLRHLIVWRYMNGSAYIPDELDISHCDHDNTILNLIAESRELNESRKSCHLFGWYKKTDANGQLLCPHRYYKKCT